MRPDNTAPLTAEEHAELAREIKHVAARLVELERLVAGVYGPGNQAAFSFTKAVECVERLQQDLDVQAAFDLPGVRNGFYR